MNFIKAVDRYIEGSYGNGLCILNDATNVIIHKEINGMNSLTFDMPSNSKKIDYILDGKYWFDMDGELYFPINVDGDDNTHLYSVTCRHIIGLMSVDNVIPDFPIMTGVTPYEILSEGLLLCGTDYWKMIPQDELPDGLEWVDDLTDVVNGYEKIDIYKLISNVIDLIGYGELYFHNNRFALVKRLGKDTNLFWSPMKNIERINNGLDLNEIKNSILVLGANDMPLDPDEFPGSIIESEESIALYGVKKGVLNFPDVVDQEELKTLALYQISEMNPDRIDKPKMSIDVNAYELDSKNVNLGDGVRIVSKELGIDEVKRIVEIDYYPFQPTKSKYIIGDRALTLEEMLARQEQFVNTYGKSVDESGDIKASAIEQLAPTLQSWKNFVFNSSFEVYSSEDKPKHWDCSEGAKVSRNSQNWGSASLMLHNGDSAIQSEDVKIDTAWYSSESNGTIVCFSHKWGSVKVRIIDADGNPIPHKSKFNTDKVTETIIPYDVYYREFISLRFLHSDIQSEQKAYRIEFTGNDENVEAYIDNVMASPDNNGIIPIYRDGAESVSYNMIGSDTGSGEGGGGGVPDADSLFNNIEYIENDSDIECVSGENTDVLTLRVKRKKTIEEEEFVNITLIYTLNLKDVKSNLDISVKKEGVKIKESSKTYNYADNDISDIITYHSTIKVSTAEIKKDTGMVFNVSVDGDCLVDIGSAMTAIMSKNVDKRELIAEFPALRYNESTKSLDDGIIGKIYLESNNKVAFDIYINETGRMPESYSEGCPWLASVNQEMNNLFKTVQILRFYGSGENCMNDFYTWFAQHPALEEIYGLEFIQIDGIGSGLVGAFTGCKKLRNAYGKLSAARLTNMFGQCDLLETVPTLDFNRDGQDVYLNNFLNGCSKLKSIEMTNWYFNTLGKPKRRRFWTIEKAFYGCSSLKKISGDIVFEPTSALNGVCVSAFENCEKLEKVNMDGEVEYNSSTGYYMGEEGWGYTDSIYTAESNRHKEYPLKVAKAFLNCPAEIICGSPNSKRLLEGTRTSE